MHLLSRSRMRGMVKIIYSNQHHLVSDYPHQAQSFHTTPEYERERRDIRDRLWQVLVLRRGRFDHHEQERRRRHDQQRIGRRELYGLR